MFSAVTYRARKARYRREGLTDRNCPSLALQKEHWQGLATNTKGGSYEIREIFAFHDSSNLSVLLSCGGPTERDDTIVGTCPAPGELHRQGSRRTRQADRRDSRRHPRHLQRPIRRRSPV